MNAQTDSMAREQEVPDSTMATLATELRTFEQHRVELLQDHAGKHALIKGSEVVGIFDNDVAAAVGRVYAVWTFTVLGQAGSG